jgi:thiol:disulfide interchange protein
MAIAALAALWLLYRQAGERGLFVGIAASIAIALLLLGFGYGQRRGARVGWAVLALCLVFAGFTAWQLPAASRAGVAASGAEVWSEAKAARYAARGNKVFVYFTADWCLSCKVNEAAAIDRDEVRDAFKSADVKVLAGDWTNGDPTITRFLEAHGRAGVPYYLWYAPGHPPEELPQILTPAMLISRARAPH